MGTEKELTVRQMRHFWRLEEKGVINRDNFQAYLNNPNRFLDGTLASDENPEARETAVTNPLLEFVGTVVIDKTAEFIARDWFVVNTKITAPLWISHLNDNFRRWFLGKTEAPSGKTDLRYYTLCQASVDGPIIAELGGAAKAETALARVYSLIEKQKNGVAGVLLNNGHVNIFYVRDVDLALRVVNVYWRGGDGWRVDAYSVEHLWWWLGGRRVFSCNS